MFTAVTNSSLYRRSISVLDIPEPDEEEDPLCSQISSVHELLKSLEAALRASKG